MTEPTAAIPSPPWRRLRRSNNPSPSNMENVPGTRPSTIFPKLIRSATHSSDELPLMPTGGESILSSLPTNSIPSERPSLDANNPEGTPRLVKLVSPEGYGSFPNKPRLPINVAGHYSPTLQSKRSPMIRSAASSSYQPKKPKLADAFRVQISDHSRAFAANSEPPSPMHRAKFAPVPAVVPSFQQRFIVLLDTTRWGAFYILSDALLTLTFAIIYIISSEYTGRIATDPNDTVAKNTMPCFLVVLDFCNALLILAHFTPRLLFCYPAQTWVSRMLRPGVLLTMITTLPCLWLRGPHRWHSPPPVYDRLPTSFDNPGGLYVASFGAHLVLAWPIRFLRLIWSMQRVLALLEARPSYFRQKIPQIINEHNRLDPSLAKRFRLWERIPWPSPVLLKVVSLIVGVICTFLTCSGYLHIIEYKYASDRANKEISFFDAFFFVFLLATTISYDSAIVPDAPFPRITILAIIFTGISYVPYGITEVVSAARMRSPFDAGVTEDAQSQHVIVVGGGALLEPFTLRHFLDEFLAPAHGPRVMSTKVIFLSACEPPPACVRVLREPVFKHRVQWIKGSTLSLEALINRAALHRARACFILARKFTADSRAADAENSLRAMAIASSNSQVPIYIQCLLPDNKRHFQYFADVVVCVDELKRAVLARSAACPGFSTLVYLLTTTIILYGARKKNNESKMVQALHADDISAAWVSSIQVSPEPSSTDPTSSGWDDFNHSASQGIYAVELHETVVNLKFSTFALSMFEDLGLLLFGLGIPTGSDTNSSYNPDIRVELAPLEHRFAGDEIAFVIGASQEDAARVSQYAAENVRATQESIDVPVARESLPEDSRSPSNDARTTFGMGVSLPKMDFQSFNLQAQNRRPKTVMFNLNNENVGKGGHARSHTMANTSHMNRRMCEALPPRPIGLHRFHTIDVPSTVREFGFASTAKGLISKPFSIFQNMPRKREKVSSSYPDQEVPIVREKAQWSSTGLLASSMDSPGNGQLANSADDLHQVRQYNSAASNSLRETSPMQENLGNAPAETPSTNDPARLVKTFDTNNWTARGHLSSPHLYTPSASEHQANPMQFQNHIVLCAPAASGVFPTNLDCFLGPLWSIRGSSRDMSSNWNPHGEQTDLQFSIEEDTRVPVVIVSDAVLPAGEWERLQAQFAAEDLLHFVHGSPLDPRKLRLAGAHRAARAIVLADDNAVVGAGKNAIEKTEDAHTIMTVLNLKEICAANTFIVAELIHNETMRFLTEYDVSTSNGEANIDETIPHRTPSFMAGNVFTASMLDSILAQAYYNPHLVYIIKQLLWTGLEDSLQEPINVLQESVLAQFADHQYCKLFAHMLLVKRAIPLGLYRTTLRGSPGAGFRRVILSPPPNLRVNADDRVFLLYR